MKNDVFGLYCKTLIICFTFFLCIFSLYFGVLSLSLIPIKLISEKFELFAKILLIILFLIFSLFSYFYISKKTLLYKLTFVLIVFLFLIFFGYFYLYSSGFLQKFNSVDDFRGYVSTFGGGSTFIYVILQFLQVIILPIPSVISTGAGVLLFGPLKGAILSIIGIVSGSLVAFFIGRIFGYKTVKWLVGEKGVNKALKSFSSSEKILIPFTLLFPFFPDDLICFVSGLTSVSTKYFLITVIFTRTISITLSCFSLNNNLIPFNTWWGILLWGIFFIITISLTFFITSNSEKIKNKLTAFNNSK